MSTRVQLAADRMLATRWLPWTLLAVSLAAHVGFSLLGADSFKLIDLRVYVDGARHLSDGVLYDFFSGQEQLPFTYPPFAALVFWPLSVLPWPVVAVLWEVGCVAALAAIIYLSLRLMGRAGPSSVQPVQHLSGVVVLGTALSMWLEPVRSTFNYGQINLFLAVLVLAGAVSARDLFAGATVGVAAGLKLTPAITGLYYLMARRGWAVLWSGLVFAVTVGVAFAALGDQVSRYFTELIFDPARTGDVWVTRNQGWRGAIFRLFGHDQVAWWLVAVVLSLALGIWACQAALRRGDRCAALLSAQFLGLMVSPISWSHHWVWMLPLLLWCLFGASRDARSVRVIGWCWAAAGFLLVVQFLIMIQNGHLETGEFRPLWESILDAVYPVLATATLVIIARPSRRPVSAA